MQTSKMTAGGSIHHDHSARVNEAATRRSVSVALLHKISMMTYLTCHRHDVDRDAGCTLNEIHISKHKIMLGLNYHACIGDM
jgi:hypothetical protein